MKKLPGANPTIQSYNASVVKIYNTNPGDVVYIEVSPRKMELWVVRSNPARAYGGSLK
jgi:hypothetical protein